MAEFSSFDVLVSAAVHFVFTRVGIFVSKDIAQVTQFVVDGIGLPQENRHRLAEPYMTTREKGTGLGLAIVKRIMEEHGGSLTLTDAPTGQGARVTLHFPRIDVLEQTPVEDALG